ncbi:MAG: DUF5050 domain-containing protein [Bacillota bacterium]|nr:DUF5050 domain-containing protein [Bacillota bacterium]
MKLAIRRIAIFGVVFLVFSATSCSSQTEIVQRNMESAQGYLQEGRTEAAVSAFKNVITEDPENIKARVVLGQIYLDRGSFLEAEYFLEEALDKESTNREIINALAKVYLQHARSLKAEKQYGDSETMLNKGLALSPNNLEFLTELKDIYKFTGRLEETELKLREIIQLNPKLTGPYIELVNMLLNEGRKPEAVALLKTGFLQTADAGMKKQLLELTSLQGNTAGNIQNKGLASKQGDCIYYSTASGLFKIKLDGTDRTKLDSRAAEYINVIGEWMFFISEPGICRIKTDGSCYNVIYKNQGQHLYSSLQVMDDYIYVLEDNRLIRLKTDGGDYQVAEEDDVIAFEVDREWIFYYKINPMGLFKMKMDGTNRTMVTEEPMYSFVEYDGVIYYIRGGFGEMESLYSMKEDGTNITRLNSDLPSYLNLSDGWLYYICNDSLGAWGEVYKIRIDGSERTKLYRKTGNILSQINTAYDLLFYEVKLSNGIDFELMKTDGSQNGALY